MDSAAPEKILVVDDEAHVRHVLELTLKKQGWTVYTAEDAFLAMELAREHHPDVIVSDYCMPGLNGMEFTLLLQENPATADIPIVMLTAHDSEVMRQPIGQRNIRAMINKPFSPSEVVELIAQLFEQRDQAGRDGDREVAA